MLGTITITGFGAEETLSGSCGDNATWFINSDDVLVISGTGTINNYSGWYDYEEGIKEIVIEEGITGTSNFLFNYCTNVEKIVFPSTLETLGHCLTKELPYLTDVWIFSKTLENNFSGNSGMYPQPGSITKWHVYEGSTTEASFREGLKCTDADFEYITENDSFPKITNREPLVLAADTDTSGPAGLNSSWSWDASTKTLTFSGSGAIIIKSGFQNYASDVVNVDMGDSEITSICPAAFGVSDAYGSASALCPNLEHITLPSTIKVIGNYAFYKAPIAEENLYLPEGLGKIGIMAFYCSKITGNLKLPSTIKSVGQQAFQSTLISSVEIPEGVTFGGTVFYGCNNLKEVTVPKNLTYNKNGEGNAARANKLFSYCTGLEKVIFEDGATIAEAMFTGCTALSDVYILTKTASISISGPSYDSSNAMFEGTPTFHVYQGSTAETALSKAGYLNDDNVVYLADTAELDKAIAEAEKADESKYTEASYEELIKAIEEAKVLKDNLDVSQEEIDNALQTINNAIKALEERPTVTNSQPTTSYPTMKLTTTKAATTAAKTTATATTRSSTDVNKDKTAAKKAMKQAKITKLTVKSKAKKKITVSWKKVNKAVGYQVQVSKKKNFKKNIVNKLTSKKKLTIKNSKIKSKKTYYVRVRAYATYKDANNKAIKVYSAWNKKLRKVKVK